LSQWEKPVAVDASAGTGKTRLLLDRLMVLLLERRVPLSRIAAITFTEKAAGELSSRLRQRLEQEWKARLEQRPTLERALEDLESSPIGTIHSFCTGMLREHALVAGLDPRFTVMDAPSSEAFADETWETWLRGLEETPALSRALSMGTRPNSLRDLKNRLLRSRASLRKPVASPLPQEEEADRILQKGLDLFDALLARCHVEDDSLVKKAGENRKLWHETSQTTGEEKVLETGLLEPFSSTRAGNKKNWGDVPLAEAREGLQRLWEDLEAFTSRTRDSVMTGLLETLWGWVEYHQVEKRRRGVLDFDDLLILSRDLLTKDASARESLRRRHDILLVDEFQDTDPLQAEIVFRLCEKSGTFAPDWRQASLQGGKLMVVGDPKQSIYRFRRADVEVYNEVLKALVGGLLRSGCLRLERELQLVPRFDALGARRLRGRGSPTRSERWAEPSAFRSEPLEEGVGPPAHHGATGRTP
jgi:ATP-dependent helicase/nuclease subunit A